MALSNFELVRVCYIIPVYRNQVGLDRTLMSIMNSCSSIEKVIVYDDGSDVPVRIKAGYPICVELIRNDKNKGASVALNTLLIRATEQAFNYAALIDAGDLQIDGRIEKQLEGFMRHPSAIIMGGDMDIIGVDGRNVGSFNPPITYQAIRKQFRRGYPFAHPTAMYDLSKLKSANIFYNPDIRASLDYEFLYRLHITNDMSIANIPDKLVCYVRETESIGVSQAGKQAREAYKCRVQNIVLDDIDSILGLFDIRLILRAISPWLFFFISDRIKLIRLLMSRYL